MTIDEIVNEYTEEMKNLVSYLNERTLEYDMGKPTISDKEWDDKYFELIQLEHRAGFALPNSPTQYIDYRVVNSLEKVEHSHKMLSLDKTKDLEEVRKFLGKSHFIAMCKMDGLTCSLTYENGRLVKAETRGNGLIGENILHNAKVIPSIPKTIDYKDRLVVDGEIICATDDFVEFAQEYKNPRNFAAGSIRLLDPKECEKRKLTFVAWDVIEGLDNIPYLDDRLLTLEIKCDFFVVPFCVYGTLEEMVDKLTYNAKMMCYPIDGIVFKFSDVDYGKSLGETSHHFKNAIAYKFYDETYWTTMKDIDWTIGRTSVLTPVAIFKPVDIDGSTVERASLHNISIMKKLFGENGPFVGQEVSVFKSNMIIPQIKEVKIDSFDSTNKISIPTKCPICGGEVEIESENDSEFLYCINPACDGKLINKLEHFCGKKGLDIKGLSKATLEKLIDWGWVSSCKDIFELSKYKLEWIKKPGFGEKSVDKVLAAIDASSNCELSAFISSLGIPLIGSTVSKDLAKHFKTWDAYIEAVNNNYHFWDLDGFGFEMYKAIVNFDYEEANIIYNNCLNIKEVYSFTQEKTNLTGQVFVITGKLAHFKNRDELKEKIEACGGKVAGSISGKTNYLINNDINSGSSKNLSAKKLNIPIITEKDFIDQFNIR